jgi:TonB-linked SusC/RagA family outer membrane protein
LLLFLCISQFSFSQSGFPVSGKITDDKGKPLEGVSVQEKGTTNVAVTGSDGSFRINVSSGLVTLTLSSVGFVNQEIQVENRQVINHTLSAFDNQMQDVVVIGYGTRKRADVTSSVVSINAEEIRSRPVANALQALQGKAAGVDITSNERPGEVGSILIRGVRSLNASNSPLYVVDGIPLNFGGIGAINPNDIESIDVLKDASATAVYGSRGANGVILITTKKGKNGAVTLNYVGTLTIERIEDRSELMNSAEYIEFRRDAYRRVRYLNPAAAANTTYPDAPSMADDQRIFGQDPYAWANVQKGWVGGKWDGSLVPTTDWTDMVKQTGVTHDHTLSVSGGTQKVKAYASFGYLKQDGTQLGQDYNRFSGRFNVDISPVKWFSMGAGITASYGTQNFGFSTTNATGPGTLYAAARGMLPYAIPFDSLGNRINLPGGDINILNPIGEEQYNENIRYTLRTLGSFYAEITPLKGLKYRVNFGPDINNFRNGRWMDARSINRGGGEPGSTNYAQLNQSSNVSWTLDNLLYYNTTIRQNHEIGATLLYSASKWKTESSTMTATRLPWNSQKWHQLNSVSALDNFSSNLEERSLLSYMARINYAYKGKYHFDAFTRWDGASQLAEGNKWDMFPAASVAWRIDRENFMDGIPWINLLKMRFGVGTVGNAAVDPGTTLGRLQTLYYTWGNVVEAGYVSSDPSTADPVSMPNYGLGWERTTQWNFGLDYVFVNNRISGSIDLYRSKTSDLLMLRSIPSTLGYIRTLDNIGVTTNRGIEISLNTTNIQGKNFNWNSTLNFSANKDRIEEVAIGKQDDIANRWFIGQPLNIFYDYEKIGIWQNTTEDLAEMAKFNANISNQNSWFRPGSIRPRDVNGDYRVDANNDLLIRGHRQPDWNAGLINEFNYKNFSLNIFIFARWGQTIEAGAESLQGRFAQRRISYWTPSNPTNEYQAPNYNSAAGDTYRNGMNYQDGSFIKIRNLTLAYNLESSLLKRMTMSTARFYVQVLNPGLLYSKIDWLDPDTGSSAWNRGFVLGVNVGF